MTEVYFGSLINTEFIVLQTCMPQLLRTLLNSAAVR